MKDIKNLQRSTRANNNAPAKLTSFPKRFTSIIRKETIILKVSP